MLEESVVYQDVLRQGERRGERKGQAHLLLRLLASRFGRVSPKITQQIEHLSTKQMEMLGIALFNFQDKTELLTWLDAHRR